MLSNIEADDICTLHDDLKKISINGHLAIRKAGYFQSIISDRPTLFRVSFMPGFPDPESYYSLFYSKSSPEINLTAFANHEFDRHFEQSRIEPDPAKRKAHFLAMESILRQNVPLIYISHSRPATWLLPQHVRGFKTRFLIFDLSEVRLGSVK